MLTAGSETNGGSGHFAPKIRIALEIGMKSKLLHFTLYFQSRCFFLLESLNIGLSCNIKKKVFPNVF